MHTNIRRTYAGFILQGYSRADAVWQTATFWRVSPDYCRASLRRSLRAPRRKRFKR